MTGRRLAVISLLADAGHLLPSLRIAQALAREGDDIAAFVPEEVGAIPERVSVTIATEVIGRVRGPGWEPLLARAARAGTVWQSLWFERLAERELYFPMMARAHDLVPTLLERVRAFRPTVVIADDILFAAAYKVIAEGAGVPLLTHIAIGSHWGAQRGLRRPWRWDSPITDPAVALGARVVASAAARLRRVSAPSAAREGRALLTRLQRDWQEFGQRTARSVHPTLRISCGMGALEAESLRGRIQLHSHVQQFGPLPAMANAPIAPDLAAWLASDSREVLYVSFGTMVPGPIPFAKAILEGARRAGLRVLWACATCPWSEEPASEDAQWATWVSQSAVLAHAKVAAFVTHAGSGAVQEAGWAALPIVSIPMLWDQEYNAWVAECLGFGTTLSRHRVTAARVADAIARVRALRAGAARVRDTFIHLDAARALREYVAL